MLTKVKMSTVKERCTLCIFSNSYNELKTFCFVQNIYLEFKIMMEV